MKLDQNRVNNQSNDRTGLTTTRTDSVFSNRVPKDRPRTELSSLISQKRSRGDTLCDLTEVNPTRVGIDFDPQRLARAIGDTNRIPYTPSPQGSPLARQAIAESYLARGHRVDREGILLTASTSESYGYLLKLLCDPGQSVLIASPGYPLVDFIARSEGVGVEHFSLLYDGRWNLDLPTVASALRRPEPRRPKAVFVVHPHSPTGGTLSERESEGLVSLCAAASVPLILDEVFLLFSGTREPIPERGDAEAPHGSFVDTDRGLVFVLDGVSKQLGLPGLKLGWIVTCGDEALVGEALGRLEWIADLFLSVSTVAQRTLPALLPEGERFRHRLVERIQRNLEILAARLAAVPSVDLVRPEGGWYATLRVPATGSSSEWARSLLATSNVITHPGDLFGLPESHLVLSLVTPEDRLASGAQSLGEFFSEFEAPFD